MRDFIMTSQDITEIHGSLGKLSKATCMLCTHLYISSYNQVRIPFVTGFGLVMMKFTQESKGSFSIFIPRAQQKDNRREHRFCHGFSFFSFSDFLLLHNILVHGLPESYAGNRGFRGGHFRVV